MCKCGGLRGLFVKKLVALRWTDSTFSMLSLVLGLHRTVLYSKIDLQSATYVRVLVFNGALKPIVLIVIHMRWLALDIIVLM